uniref:CCHC-type domain-containing protein n=1 Tax=Ceratitis capitata TaxID=7213 RepID=W8AVY4_CERCA
MVKIQDLTIPLLKRELAKRGLSTTGNKAELQSRLREAMEVEGIDLNQYEFHREDEDVSLKDIDKEEADGSVKELESPSSKIQEKAPGSSKGIDMNMLLTAISQNMSQMMAAQEASISQKLDAQDTKMNASIAQNMSEMRASISQKMDAQNANIASQMAQIQQDLLRNNAELKERQDLIETKVNALESRVRELQLNRPTASVNAPKVKTPSFDGKIPFQVFKLQFEKTAETNNWSIEEKSAALFVALEGPAAELLQTISVNERNDYDGLMRALERRYGSEHRRQIYQMELEKRDQKSNESLQEYASEVERLAHLAIGDTSGEHLERVKIQRFISGIKDVYTKRETYANPKLTFAETVAYAQTRETAALISRPSYKVNKVEVETPDVMTEILRTLKSLEGMNRSGFKTQAGKCFKCGKPGHYARECKTSSSRQEVQRKRKAEEDEPSTSQSLN